MRKIPISLNLFHAANAGIADLYFVRLQGYMKAGSCKHSYVSVTYSLNFIKESRSRRGLPGRVVFLTVL